MPSDEVVEKVARAIYDELEGPVANQDFMRQQRQWELAQRLAKAALAAAEAGEPVAAWECFRDEAFFDMWCVRPKGERRFGHSFHVTTEEEAEGLVALLSASPPSEASREERAAIRKEAFEEAANVVEPKEPRPCDCTRCYCGNGTDAQEVAAWDEAMANATAIRARGET